MAVQAGILVQVEPINGKSKIENRDNTLNGMKNQVSHVWSSFLCFYPIHKRIAHFCIKIKKRVFTTC